MRAGVEKEKLDQRGRKVFKGRREKPDLLARRVLPAPRESPNNRDIQSSRLSTDNKTNRHVEAPSYVDINM